MLGAECPDELVLHYSIPTEKLWHPPRGVLPPYEKIGPPPTWTE